MNLLDAPPQEPSPRGKGIHLPRFLDRLLHRQTILLLSLFLFAGIIAALWNMSQLSSGLIKVQALQTTTLYAQAMQEARTLYSTEAVDRLKIHNIPITHDYNTQSGAIPLPVTFLMDLSKRLQAKNPGMSVRLYSDYPFPWRSAESGVRDQFEEEALQQFRSHSQENFVRFEPYQGKYSIRFAQADVMQASCVSCHNNHPDSPKRDWKVGDVRGVLEISLPLDGYINKTNMWLQGTFITLGGLSTLGIAGIGVVVSKLRQTSKELEHRVIERTAELQATNQQLQEEQEKSERLLLNILPEPIADRLKEGRHNIADGFAEATVLFADIVNFTQLSEQLSPIELVSLLNQIFSNFDQLTEKYKLEKIKTIGDAYMVVGGLPDPRTDHAEAIAVMALAMRQTLVAISQRTGYPLNIRIGINTGPVVAGVIGKKKFIYDLWGDTVNTASRMESHGLIGGIQVTQATYDRLKNRFTFQSRGIISVKGKGEMPTYLLTGIKGGAQFGAQVAC